MTTETKKTKQKKMKRIQNYEENADESKSGEDNPKVNPYI